MAIIFIKAQLSIASHCAVMPGVILTFVITATTDARLVGITFADVGVKFGLCQVDEILQRLNGQLANLQLGFAFPFCQALKQHVAVISPSSLIGYVVRFKDERSVIFADTENISASARCLTITWMEKHRSKIRTSLHMTALCPMSGKRLINLTLKKWIR